MPTAAEPLFVDTSAILAALDESADRHADVVAAWEDALERGADLVTTNYVVVETTAVAQHRFGLRAVRTLESTVWPALTVVWISEETHRSAVSALLAADRRGLSLVDCTSFEVMRKHRLRTALALDADFDRQGFAVRPD